MTNVPLRRLWPLLALTGCTGSGSDIGPTLDALPNASHKVLVLDDSGRAVAAARVTIDGATAVSGRSGRGELFRNPTGRRIVTVDAAAASATTSDRLASLAFAAEIGGQDLPFAIHLPDVATAASGVNLVIGGGTVIDPPTAVPVVAELARTHLPGELPLASSGARLWTRGFFVDPPEVTFAPGATLDVPDELGMPGASPAQLWRLDATTGEWTLVSATAATASAGRLQLPNGITQGGLYAYATEVAAVATVTGRIVDLQARPVSGALVRVDSAHGIAGDDGSFRIAVAATLADGTARTAAVEYHGGALWLPAGGSAVTPTLAAGATLDLGDLVLDTSPAGNVRLQLLSRGRAEPFRTIPWSSVDGSTAGVTYSDARGQVTLEEIGSGYFGFFVGRPQDRFEVLVAEAISLLPGGRRWDDRNLFFDDRNWVVGSRSTRTQALDARGGGPIRDAIVVRGTVPGQGFSGITRENGIIGVGRSFDGRATVTARTTRPGTSVVSAFTFDRPNADHLEVPLRRALRTGGSFDRHGTLAGSVTGVLGGETLRVRAGRPLEFDEWFDEVVLGEEARSAVPVRTGSPTATSFRAGVALPRGHVAAAAGTLAGSDFTLTGLGVALDREVAEGSAVSGDITLRRTLASFTTPQGFGNLDAALTTADFTLDLGFAQGSERVVDCARDVAGGITAVGSDATFSLPALADEFATGAWLVVLTGENAGGTVRQQSMVRFDGATARATPLLEVPTITAPLDGTTVAADGFTVQFALPAGSAYATIDLSSPGADTLTWTVVVPPDVTSFTFVRLPQEATSPLVAGRSYTMALTAYRIDEGDVLLQQDQYRELTTHWYAIGAGERGVRALSRRTIQITAN